jgi:hypothetical protein
MPVASVKLLDDAFRQAVLDADFMALYSILVNKKKVKKFPSTATFHFQKVNTPLQDK